MRDIMLTEQQVIQVRLEHLEARLRVVQAARARAIARTRARRARRVRARRDRAAGNRV